MDIIESWWSAAERRGSSTGRRGAEDHGPEGNKSPTCSPYSLTCLTSWEPHVAGANWPSSRSWRSIHFEQLSTDVLV
jgi:hypothetical protein